MYLTAPGDEPQNFEATSITSTSITLSWDVPATPNGILTTYILSYGKETVVLHGSNSSYAVQDLEEYTVFMFSIRARTRVGQAGPAATLTVSTAQDGK